MAIGDPLDNYRVVLITHEGIKTQVKREYEVDPNDPFIEVNQWRQQAEFLGLGSTEQIQKDDALWQAANWIDEVLDPRVLLEGDKTQLVSQAKAYLSDNPDRPNDLPDPVE